MSVCLDIGCGTLCRSGSCMLRCWLWDAVPIWFLYASVLVVERCADFFLYVVFFCHWAGCTFASILCSLRLNFQPGMWQRYGLLPHPRRTVHSIHHNKGLKITTCAVHPTTQRKRRPPQKTRQPSFPHTSYIGNRNTEKKSIC